MLARSGFLHVENVFPPTTQASGFVAGRNRAGYLDRLLMSLSGNGRKSLAFRLILQYYKLGIRISKSETNLS